MGLVEAQEELMNFSGLHFQLSTSNCKNIQFLLVCPSVLITKSATWKMYAEKSAYLQLEWLILNSRVDDEVDNQHNEEEEEEDNKNEKEKKEKEEDDNDDNNNEQE